MKQIIEEMFLGPAQLSPGIADVDAMTSYHEAIAADKPFVIITNAESFKSGATSTLRGEASLGTTVRVVSDENTSNVARENVGWYLDNAPPPPLMVEVESPAGVNRLRLE